MYFKKRNNDVDIRNNTENKLSSAGDHVRRGFCFLEAVN